MPLTEWELWTVANETICQHDAEAIAFAEARAAALLQEGDEAGAMTWIDIAVRIERLQSGIGDNTLH